MSDFTEPRIVPPRGGSATAPPMAKIEFNPSVPNSVHLALTILKEFPNEPDLQEHRREARRIVLEYLKGVKA